MRTESRRRITELNKQLQQIKQDASKKQTHLDQLRAQKHKLLKRCKVDDIPLPFAKGSFDDVEQEEEVQENISNAAPSLESNSIASEVLSCPSLCLLSVVTVPAQGRLLTDVVLYRSSGGSTHL